MNKCFYCGKGTVMGRSHTHHRGVAGGRWKKRAVKTNRPFKANLQRVTILVGGKPVQVKLCTKCIKRIKRDISLGERPFLQLANISFKHNAEMAEVGQPLLI